MNALNLPAFVILDTQQDENDLHFFLETVTNTYTEALNGIIKLINKTGRGYKFNVLRAKILFSEGTHKIITPKFNRRPASSSIASIRDMLISEPGADYQIRDHGVDMYALIHILEDSSFFPDPH